MTIPLALLLVPALSAAPVPGLDGAELTPQVEQAAAPALPSGAEAPVWSALVDAFQAEVQQQVRIERRTIVRISPRLSLQDEGLDAPAAQAAPRRLEERRMGKCVPIKGISSVQISQQDRLLLFMHDRRIVSVKLGKSCSVRDFYSGFYVENSDDGMICAGRDTLHSRAGVTCEVSRLHKLVPDGD